MADTEYIGYLKDLFDMILQLANIPKDIIDNMTTQDKKRYIEEPGVKSLLEYVKKGGHTMNIEVSPENIEEFRNKMQQEHITNFELQNTKEDGTMSYTYVFRDCDAQRVNVIKKAFEAEISKNATELDIYTFREMMKGKDVAIANNLTIDELYAFRNNVQNTNLKYVVTKGPDGNYNIYANNSTKLTDTLMLSAYDIASEQGRQFKNDVDTYVNKKNDLFDRINNKETLIIADSKNPNNFIYCGPDGFSVHSFAKQKEIVNGQEIEKVKDVIKPTIYSYENKEHLMKIAGQFNNAVIIAPEDFTILNSVDKQGKAYASETINQDYINVFEQNKDRLPDIEKQPKIRNNKQKDIIGYSHIPLNVLENMKIEMSHIDITMDDKGNIAFDKQYKDEIDRYLDKKYFKKIEINDDYFERKADEWQIKNKAGHIKVDFKDPDFCIIDSYNGNICAKIDKDGTHIYKDGEEVKMVSSASEGYMDALKDYIEDLKSKNIVILTEDEINSPYRSQLILDRANGLYENDAVISVINRDDIKKQELIDNKNRLYDIELSPEQRKAVNRTKDINVYTKEYTNHTYREMQDHNISKTFEKTETTTQTHKTSHSL